MAQSESQPSAGATGRNVEAAQRDDSFVAEIVVTAQKRSENLQDVPIAITALDGASLADAGVGDVQNLQVAVPGMSTAKLLGYTLPRIRGVGTGAIGPGIESSVAVYIDGVYLVSPFAGTLAFNNIAQVAVLKGPQGTLFGRNATGGVVQITTLDPGRDPALDISATLANHETYGANLYAAAPLTSTLSADISAYYSNRSDGFGRNLVTGEDVGDGYSWGVRGKLKWEPTDSTTVRLSADYAMTDDDLIVQHIAKGTLPISGIPYTGPDFSMAQDGDNHQRIETGGVSLHVEQDVGALSLVSITGYRRGLIDTNFDSDGQNIPLTEVLLKQKDRQFSQELQLISPKSGPFTWLLGAYYFDASGRYPFQTAIVGAPPFTAPPTRITSTARQDTKSIAGFAQGTLALTDATNFTAGIRYTSDKREIVNSRQVTLPSGVALPTAVRQGEATFNKVTWRLSLDHRFSDEFLAYASFNRGFKSGLFDPTTQPLNALRPEVLDAYEIGFKADLFDRIVRINAAAFHYDYTDIQINRIINGQIFLFNAAGAKIDGVDLDITARITPRLTVTAGFSYLDNRITSFPDAPASTPLTTGGNAISSGDAKGNRLPYVPDYTVNLQGSYTVPIGDGELELTATYFHSDGYFEGAENRLRQKPFDLVNGAMNYSFGHWRASLWGKNIFNQFYAPQISAQARGDSFIAGEPRTFGITLGYRL